MLSWMSARARWLPRLDGRLVVGPGEPAPRQLLDRGDVDDPVVQERLQRRHVADQERPVGGDGVAGQRRAAALGAVLADVGEHLPLGLGQRDAVRRARRAGRTSRASADVVAHLLDRLGRRLDDDVDAVAEHVEVEVGHQGGDLDQRVVLRGRDRSSHSRSRPVARSRAATLVPRGSAVSATVQHRGLPSRPVTSDDAWCRWLGLAARLLVGGVWSSPGAEAAGPGRERRGRPRLPGPAGRAGRRRSVSCCRCSRSSSALLLVLGLLTRGAAVVAACSSSSSSSGSPRSGRAGSRSTAAASAAVATTPTPPRSTPGRSPGTSDCFRLGVRSSGCRTTRLSLDSAFTDSFDPKVPEHVHEANKKVRAERAAALHGRARGPPKRRRTLTVGGIVARRWCWSWRSASPSTGSRQPPTTSTAAATGHEYGVTDRRRRTRRTRS